MRGVEITGISGQKNTLKDFRGLNRKFWRHFRNFNGMKPLVDAEAINVFYFNFLEFARFFCSKKI